MRPSSCHGDFQSLPRQSVVHDDTRVIRPSVGNTGCTDDSVATDGPHRPTVGSRPWTSPAKERAVALTARYFRRRLRHDRPQHRSTSRWPPPRSGITAATGWKAKNMGQEGSKEVESWADLVSRSSLYLLWCGSSPIHRCPSAATVLVSHWPFGRKRTGNKME